MQPAQRGRFGRRRAQRELAPCRSARTRRLQRLRDRGVVEPLEAVAASLARLHRADSMPFARRRGGSASRGESHSCGWDPRRRRGGGGWKVHAWTHGAGELERDDASRHTFHDSRSPNPLVRAQARCQCGITAGGNTVGGTSLAAHTSTRARPQPPRVREAERWSPTEAGPIRGAQAVGGGGVAG